MSGNAGGKEALALIDGGSQASLITEEFVDKLGLTPRIKTRNIPAKSWANECLYFTGTIKIEFQLAGQKFRHNFYTCTHLATKTHMLLGLDWLKRANISIEYRCDKVNIYMNQLLIPLFDTGKQLLVNTLNVPVYALQTVPELPKCKLDIAILIPANQCKVLKVILPDIPCQWGCTAHFDRYFSDNLEIPSQISSVHTHETNQYFSYILAHNY